MISDLAKEKAMKIRLLAAGGTIEKIYNPIAGQLDFKNSRMQAMLEQARCSLPISVEVVFLKDSLDMTDEDRAVLVAACQRSPEQHIILTHGTDTMTDTALCLQAAALDKTIVLTGAMVPLALEQSDGFFNLGAAIVAVQYLPVGVYIAMNGRVFPAANVAKNRQKGLFEPL